jgi:hypothetical protein
VKTWFFKPLLFTNATCTATSRALSVERVALAGARAEREAYESEVGAEVKELRTECANLKITNEAVLRDTRRLSQEATSLRMDNLRLSNYQDTMARMQGLAADAPSYKHSTGGGGGGADGGGHEGEDEKSRQRRLNKAGRGVQLENPADPRLESAWFYKPTNP